MEPFLVTRENEALEALSDDLLEINAEIRSVLAQKPLPATKVAENRLRQTVDQLTDQTIRAELAFKDLEKHATKATRAFRKFCTKSLIDEDTDIPDQLKTSFFVVVAVVVEGVAAGALYMLGGKMDSIAQAMGYGLSFAATNVMMALFIGFFAIRYGCIKHHDQLSVRVLKALAWLGFGVGTGLLGLLIFTGSRVRSLGTHIDIFNFEKLSLAATYTDGFTVLLFTLVLISSAVGIWKGATGFSHFVVGLSRHQRRVTELDQLGEDLADDYEDALQNIVDRATDQYEKSSADPDEVEDFKELAATLLENVDAYNARVDRCKKIRVDLRQTNQRVVAQPTFDSDVDMAPWYKDIAELEKSLAISAPLDNAEAVFTQIDTELKSGISAVKAAFLSYLNSHKNPDSGVEDDDDD